MRKPEPCHEGPDVVKLCAYVKRGVRETVAFSAWQYPYALTEEQRKEKEAQDRSAIDEPPEGSNNQFITDFCTQLFDGRKKWILPEKTFCE